MKRQLNDGAITHDGTRFLITSAVRQRKKQEDPDFVLVRWSLCIFSRQQSPVGFEYKCKVEMFATFGISFWTSSYVVAVSKGSHQTSTISQ